MSWPLSFIFLGHFPYVLPYHLGCFSSELFPCLDNLVYHCAFTSRWSAKSRFEIRHCIIISVTLIPCCHHFSIFPDTVLWRLPCCDGNVEKGECALQWPGHLKSFKGGILGRGAAPVCFFPLHWPLQFSWWCTGQSDKHRLISLPLQCFLSWALQLRRASRRDQRSLGHCCCALAEIGASSMVSWMFTLICFGSNIPVGGRELSK